MSTDQNPMTLCVQRYSITKDDTHFCQKQVEPVLNIPEWMSLLRAIKIWDLRIRSSACEVHVGHRSMVFIYPSAVEHLTIKRPLYSLLLIVHVRTVSRQNRTPKKTTGHRLKDCLPSEDTKTFWKKVSLLLVVLL